MSEDKISLDFSKTKVKSQERSRGRMKITVKLNKEEAVAYKNMKASLVPDGVSDDNFVRSVFFMGLEQFHKNTMEMMQKYVKENEEKLRSEGVDVDSIFESVPVEEEVETPEQEPEE
jgi:hypothetical protein